MIRIIEDILNLFYPRLCLICEKPLVEGEKHICLDCQYNLPVTLYHRNKNNAIRALFAGFPQLEDASAYWFFEKEGPTQKLIHSFKYRDNKELAEYLGHITALELNTAGYYTSIDTIIPVPLHPKKKRKRGYNQSEYIARGIASVYNVPINTDSLIRTVYTETQTHKSKYERHTNVENIFALKDAKNLIGKHILLVDDVITTGATTSACIESLTAVPDIKISVFGLSIARSN